MSLFSSTKARLACLFILLNVFCLAPVWSFEFFINQDGSPHVYSSFAMLELLRGSQPFGEVFAFNSPTVPNSSGHWLMVLLLVFFTSFTVTKIIVSLTFAGFVAAAGWLRYRTSGFDGVATSFLFGAAVGFNWLWLVGFYNFLIGAICFIFTIGLFYRWREKLTFSKAIPLAALFLLAYISHIVSFAVLAGGVLCLAAFSKKDRVRRNIACVVLALVPIIPLTLAFRSVTAGGGGFSPVWRNLESAFSPQSWFAQLRTADPFILISRKSLPFLGDDSPLFVIFTPLVWVVAAILFLFTASILARKTSPLATKKNAAFTLLFVGCLFSALFAPDDFGLNNGSVLRERLVICGIMFAVPLFTTASSRKLECAARICLLVVITFQTAALWEYSLKTNNDAAEFFRLRSFVAQSDRIASITIFREAPRFSSTPVAMIGNYLGTEEKCIVWDNYEIGHYLFPVIAANSAEKQFVLELTQNSALKSSSPENFDLRIARLETVLRENHQRVDKLIVWGTDEKVAALVGRWFKPEYQSEKSVIYVRR